MLVNDTIAAIATGMGNAGVGIIRISGKNAVEALLKRCSGRQMKRKK